MGVTIRHRWECVRQPLWWALALAVAFYGVWRIPPLQSPDEFLHLFRASLIAQGEFGLIHPDATALAHGARSFELGGMVDRSWLVFKDLHVPLMLDPKATLSAADTALVERLAWSGEGVYTELPGAGRYMPLVYAPHALAIWVGQGLGWGVLHTYYLVRVVCVLLCLWLLYLASRCTPLNAVTLGIVLLPMSLFQLFSPTVDGLTTSLLVLSLALASGLLTGRCDARGRWFLAMAACVWVVVSARQNMLPLLLLPWLVAWHQRSAWYLAGAAGLSVAAVLWTLLAMVGVPETRLPGAHSATQALGFYVQNPNAFGLILKDTLTDIETLVFYGKSTIGILGWLNILLPDWAYFAIPAVLGLLLLLAVVGVDRRSPVPVPGLSVAVLLSAILCVLLTFVALLLTWTPMGAKTVQGVQGRYFIQPLLLMAFVFDFRPLGQWAYRLGRWLVMFLLLLSVGSLYQALQQRFI